MKKGMDGVHPGLKVKGNPRNPQKITRTEKGYECFSDFWDKQRRKEETIIYLRYCLPGSILSAFMDAMRGLNREKLHCTATICKCSKTTFD